MPISTFHPKSKYITHCFSKEIPFSYCNCSILFLETWNLITSDDVFVIEEIIHEG